MMLKCHICSSFNGETETKVIVVFFMKCGDSVPGVDTDRKIKKRTLEGGQNTEIKRVVSVTTFISTRLFLLLAEM